MKRKSSPVLLVTVFLCSFLSVLALWFLIRPSTPPPSAIPLPNCPEFTCPPCVESKAAPSSWFAPPDPAVLLARASSVRKENEREMAAAIEPRALKSRADRDFSFWELLLPQYSCPWEERIGGTGDGGKFLCNVRRLESPCVVYSVGSNNDVKFEEGIREQTSCEIHVFDPFVSTGRGRIQSLSNAEFHSVGISVGDEPNLIDSRGKDMKTLPEITKWLGHDQIDVLKMDCEGCEWGALGTWLSLPESERTFVGQLVVEIHGPGPWGGLRERSQMVEDPKLTAELVRQDVERIERLWKQMQNAGYLLFHVEPNWRWGCCAETSWIHRSLTPIGQNF